MWRWASATGKLNKACDEVCDALERSGPSAAELKALLAELPPAQREHVASCEECRTFAAELQEVRAILSVPREEQAQPGPFFLARVMASIADRESRLEKSAQTWAAVPRLAYRFSVLACLSLLIAGSWLYEMPKAPAPGAGPQLSEGLVDNGAALDDALVGEISR